MNMRLNKLFALFFLMLLSIVTPLTRATQVVAINQNTPPISAASDNDTHPVNKNRHQKSKLHPQKVPPLVGEMPAGHLMLIQVPYVLNQDSSVSMLSHHGIGKTTRLSVTIRLKKSSSQVKTKHLKIAPTYLLI